METEEDVTRNDRGYLQWGTSAKSRRIHIFKAKENELKKAETKKFWSSFILFLRITLDVDIRKVIKRWNYIKAAETAKSNINEIQRIIFENEDVATSLRWFLRTSTELETNSAIERNLDWLGHFFKMSFRDDDKRTTMDIKIQRNRRKEIIIKIFWQSNATSLGLQTGMYQRKFKSTGSKMKT